jgi:hypothetical protein
LELNLQKISVKEKVKQVEKSKWNSKVNMQILDFKSTMRILVYKKHNALQLKFQNN